MGVTSGSRAMPLDGFTLHIFTSSGIFTPQFTGNVEILVVGAGGGGGMDMGGGGGGGEVYSSTSYAVTANTPITVTIGAGGTGAPGGGESGQNAGHQFTIAATAGSSTVFGTVTATGGGKGGSSYFLYTPDNGYGGNGSSGGGASGYSDGNTGRAGSGTVGKGYNGGANAGQYYAGGGGGAGAVGGTGTASKAAVGGAGLLNSILGVDYYWGGGGGGATYSTLGGAGGIGGGGSAGTSPDNGGAGFNIGGPGGNPGSFPTASHLNRPGGDGGKNTGGGGGGGSHYLRNNRGGNGGSGIVIVKYLSVLSSTSTGGNKIFRNNVSMKLDAGNPKSYSGTGTTLTDISGKGKNGTLTNSPTYNSGNNGHLVFDGIDDTVTISTINLGNGNIDWAVNCWMKTTSTANTLGSNPILSNSASGPVYSVLAINNGKITYWTYQASAWAQKQGIHNSISDNVWHMCTWVNFSNYTMSMYVDGVLVGTVLDSTSGNNNPVDVIGGSWAGKFSGGIAKLAIYNRQLTASEIKTLFTASRGRFGV
jgi:hypothetical protein